MEAALLFNDTQHSEDEIIFESDYSRPKITILGLGNILFKDEGTRAQRTGKRKPA